MGKRARGARRRPVQGGSTQRPAAVAVVPVANHGVEVDSDEGYDYPGDFDTDRGDELSKAIRGSKLLTPDDVAELLQVRKQLLYKWRSAGDGPPSIKAGRYVRYLLDDFEKWIADQAR